MNEKKTPNPFIFFAFAAFLACGVLVQLPGSAVASGENLELGPATVTAGRVAGDDNSARFYMDLDRKVEFSTFLMDDPTRVVIDGPSMLFRFENPEDLNPRGVISYLRYGAISRDRSRIVISLRRPAKISAKSMRELDSAGKYRLTVDLTTISARAFKERIRRQQDLMGKSGESARKGGRVRPAQRREGRFLVVVDPGHGGIDGGAKGARGIREKDITLAVARHLAAKIRAEGPFDVKLTRDSDIFLSLKERVSFARRNRADLVISIHADSLRQKWVRGASVYTLSRNASDHLAAELAESERMADIVAGLDDPVEDDAVTDILADLTARETKVFSRSFSSTLVRLLSSDIHMIKNPQRSADFVILKAPEVPGVLIELGYLSNEDDEKLMTDPKWQREIARLLAGSVRAFFQPRF